MTSYTLQVQPRASYTIEYSNERGPQGPTGPAGATTTDASLLVSGTLADARLSSNVLLVSGNLAGLASAATSRTNLGLGTGDSPSFVGLTVTGTGTLQLPSGTTAQRVASQGIRWNTTDSRHEFYTGSTWYNHARLTGDTFTGAVGVSANGAASAPATTLTGTWFTGGTATTTKPQLLVEPTGTTSTNWSTSGTGLGINAASGFGGDLINAQIASSNIFRVSSGSVVSASFFRDSGNQANYFGGGINARNTWLVAYSNDGTDFGTKDLSFGRASAGVLQIGNGTANASGSLLLTNLTASGTVQVGGGTIVASILSATATLDFASIAANSVGDLTITVTGAAVGDTVAIGVPNGSLVADVSFFGWVSATNTVTIRATNNSSTTARDPASGTFRATVIRF